MKLYATQSVYTKKIDQVCLFDNHFLLFDFFSSKIHTQEKQKNYALEEYGSDSRCMLHNHTWQIYSHGCQSRTIVSKTVGCYKHMCVEGLGLVIQIDNKEFLCSSENQLIEFTIVNEYKAVYFGNIICPACDEVCQVRVDRIYSDTRFESDTEFILLLSFIKNKIQCPNEENNVKKLSNDFQSKSQSRHHQKLCYQQLNKSNLSFIKLKLFFFVWLLLFANHNNFVCLFEAIINWICNEFFFSFYLSFEKIK